VRITALTPQPRRPERLNVFVDGELRLAVPVELAGELGLGAGEEVDEALLLRALDADSRWRAREAALALLAYRARSAAELRRRLLRKEFPADIIEQVVAELGERGHVDDAGFARAFVRDRLGAGRPRGRGRLVQELRARGVAGDEAVGAVDAVLREGAHSEEDLARRAAEAWLCRAGTGTSGTDARRRLYAYLGRRGFFGAAARAAIDAVLGEG
jgi:regulatory protein